MTHEQKERMKMLKPNQLKAIENLRCANRKEMMVAIAEIVNGKIRDSRMDTFERASKRIFVDEYKIDFDFSKGKCKRVTVENIRTNESDWHYMN